MEGVRGRGMIFDSRNALNNGYRRQQTRERASNLIYAPGGRAGPAGRGPHATNQKVSRVRSYGGFKTSSPLKASAASNKVYFMTSGLGGTVKSLLKCLIPRITLSRACFQRPLGAFLPLRRRKVKRMSEIILLQCPASVLLLTLQIRSIERPFPCYVQGV